MVEITIARFEPETGEANNNRNYCNMQAQTHYVITVCKTKKPNERVVSRIMGDELGILTETLYLLLYERLSNQTNLVFSRHVSYLKPSSSPPSPCPVPLHETHHISPVAGLWHLIRRDI